MRNNIPPSPAPCGSFFIPTPSLPPSMREVSVRLRRADGGSCPHAAPIHLPPLVVQGEGREGIRSLFPTYSQPRKHSLPLPPTAISPSHAAPIHPPPLVVQGEGREGIRSHFPTPSQPHKHSLPLPPTTGSPPRPHSDIPTLSPLCPHGNIPLSRPAGDFYPNHRPP